MPDVSRVEPLVRVLDKINRSDVSSPPEFQDDVVDSMLPLRAAEYISARRALTQDCVTLQLIDDDIEECRMRIARAQAQIRSLERQRDAVQRRVSVHRARLSPLRRVPDQVLQEIFQHCLADTPCIVPNVRTAPMVLTHVCRRWRAIAHGTSELWSSITLHDRGIWNYDLKVEMVKRWLGRSCMRPLRLGITCPPHTDFGPGGSALRSDIFRLAIAHSAQLSDLCLNVNATYLRHFMDCARLPALRSIVVSLHAVHRIDEPQEPTPPPSISVPRLRHVAFRGNGTSIDLFPRTLFPQIAHLTFDCNMTLDFALLFQDFPSLEHLTLALSFSRSRNTLRFRKLPHGDSRIVSPSLRCLEVCLDEDLPHLGQQTELETMLDQLELPALETLVIAAPLQPRYHARTGWTRAVATEKKEDEQASWENHAAAAWLRSPSVALLLSRSRHARLKFERRDLGGVGSVNLIGV